MNGDVNGTMENLKEASPSNTPDNISEQKVTSDNCDDADNNYVNSNETDITMLVDGVIDISSDIGLSKSSIIENSDSSDVNQLQEMSSDSIQLSTHENSNSPTGQSHGEDSDDSTYMNMLIDSITSSDKSEQDLDQLKSLKQQDNDKNNTSVTENGEAVGIQITVEVENSENDSLDCFISEEPKVEYTVSILSDSGSEGDDTFQNIQSQNKDGGNIMLDVDKVHQRHSSNVLEVESDKEDCAVTKDNKSNSNHSDEKSQLRRSNRTRKRKRYSDEIENGSEYDIKEVGFEDPMMKKNTPIVINDTKALVAMAARQMKVGNSHKKEPTVVIIDTNSLSGKSLAQPIKISNTTATSLNHQKLYQSIAARGTTVTPVSSKKATSTQVATQNTQPNILPSLTDDMFVVEAPSFIVPYVYEKPSVKPFREFVDKLGRVLEEQKIKEQKEEEERRDKEQKERNQRGEIVESDEEIKNDHKEVTEEEGAKKKQIKKEQKKPRNDEDDASWDGESLSESDDEILSDEDDKIVVKEKVEAIEQLKDVADLTADKICSNKSSTVSSMDCTLGKFFINIGLNLVQEYVQSDLLKQQNRKLYKEKKAGHSTKVTEASIVQLMKNLEFSKKNNAPYTFPQNKCEFCSFRSESKLVLAQHLETPHMKNNVYKCNNCSFEIRNPHDILYHMEAEHNIVGKLERAPSYHQCSNCPFEDNGKGKLARHLSACAKKFKPDMNLAPPVDWESPAKIPKIAKPRSNLVGTYQNAYNRGHMGTNIRTPISVANLVQSSTGFRPRGRSPMGVPPRAAPVHGTPIMRGGVMIRHNSPSPVLLSYPIIVNNSKPKSQQQPSISITPLPRQPQPTQLTPPAQGNSKSTFVICEICDGYIKDLEQLRNHMQWIHKVKIHPKMIYNRPPLNCQKCQFRFFTDQGLERHLLGTHGLVTSSMQEAANKGKDAGRCPVCGRVYQWKLLNHVARDHSMSLKPAHLSYKCTVCTATFGMYKQFENHVYSAHSVVAKRVIDKTKTSTLTSKTNDTLLKPLKINDEITIIPQPASKTTNKGK